MSNDIILYTFNIKCLILNKLKKRKNDIYTSKVEL